MPKAMRCRREVSGQAPVRNRGTMVAQWTIIISCCRGHMWPKPKSVALASGIDQSVFMLENSKQVQFEKVRHKVLAPLRLRERYQIIDQ